MKKTLLYAASAIALVASTSSYAQMADTGVNANIETRAEVDADANRTINQDTTREYTAEEAANGVERGLESTADAISNTAEGISDATKDVYNDVRDSVDVRTRTDADFDARVNGDANVDANLEADNDMELETMYVDKNKTATGTIGQVVYNKNGDRVAKVRDIILSANGNATMVVLGDGDFTGLGKLIAVDYSRVTNRTEDGDVMSSITEDMIDGATAFSYDLDDENDTVRMIPESGYSVAELLDGNLVGADGKVLADVENITFVNGRADQIVVAYSEILGLGGENAAISFNEVDVVRKDSGIDFALSAQETAQFKAYKKQKNK